MNIDIQKLMRDIKSIKGRGQTLDKDIQDAALRAVTVACKDPEVGGTGNLYPINSLYLALSKGARHVAMTTWVQAYGGLIANTGADKDLKPFVHSKDKMLDLEGGKANPWYDCKPSPKPDEVMDYLKLVMGLLKKKPKDGQTVAHVELRDKLAALVAEVSATEADAANEANDESGE